VKITTVFEVHTTEEQRSIARILGPKGLNAKDIHKEMSPIYGGKCLCVVSMCALLAAEELDVFCSCLFILGRCTVNLNILPPKIEALQMGPQAQTGNFLENGYNDFD
jgi:hypothetical protein